jgi:site-specific recombinase XerD
MGAPELTRFLSSLAVDRKVAASTQNQALSALLFLYRAVLELDLPWLDDVVRAKRPQRLPIVLTREEVRAALQPLEGVPRLMAHLLYGAGLRLLECCRLRVQDVDFASNQIVVRTGKGEKDRVTMLPAVVKADLARHLEGVREQHGRDLQYGRVGSSSPTRSGGSTQTRAGSGCGSGSSPRRASMWTATPTSGAGTTCTSPCSSAG